MPFRESLATDTFRFSLSIMGAPNTGKTRSLRTLPTPCCIVSMPGEEGTRSLPIGLDGFKVFRWEEEDFNRPAAWKSTRDAVRTMMAEILAGKHGTFVSLALDGMHKYYALHAAYVRGALYGEEALKADYRKVSPPVNESFFRDVMLWKQHAPPIFVMTYWVGYKAEDPNDEESPEHLFPGLSGKAGERIVGETDGTVHAYREGVGPAAKFVWGTKPTPKVWGVGIKGDPTIIDRIPPVVPQDWKMLEPYLKGEKK